MALLIESQSALSSFFAEFGYLGPFLVLVACGFGFPLPEEVTMLGSGFLLYQGRVDGVPIVLVCIAATLIGDSVPYWVGRKYGRRALAIRPIGALLHQERIASLERRFERNGDRAIFVCRFLPGLRLPAWFTAGTLGMRYPRFLLIDGLGAMIMTPAFVYLGYRSGEKIAELEAKVENLHQILGFVVLALAAAFITHLAFGKDGLVWRRGQAAERAGDQAPGGGPDRRPDDAVDRRSDGDRRASGPGAGPGTGRGDGPDVADSGGPSDRLADRRMEPPSDIADGDRP